MQDHIEEIFSKQNKINNTVNLQIISINVLLQIHIHKHMHITMPIYMCT